MKTAEFLDFSGGLTDKDIPGKTNRLSAVDNVLLDADKKPYSRDGFDIFSSTAYQLAAAERVARLVSFNSDAELLAFQNKKAFAISAGAWTEVVGPNSLKAFPSNTADSLLEESQWNKQCYIATNSGDPVIKMYRDGSNVMQLRTAGLPAFGAYTAGVADLTPSDGGLALAIALANDLRTQMIAHYDADTASLGTPNNSSTGAHYPDAELAAQYTAVNGSTVATDLSSLRTLVGVLRTQYALHIADAGKFFFSSGAGNFSRKYHLKFGVNYRHYTAATTTNQPSFSAVSMLNFYPEEDTAIPSAAPISVVLDVLNDLRDKWNWHAYSTVTHYNAVHFEGTGYFTQLALHKTSLSRVEPYTWAKISPDYGSFIQYVKDIKTEYDAHRVSDSHMEDDTVNVVNAGYPTTPTTFHEAVTLLGALMTEINYHIEDGSASNAVSDLTYAGAGPATAVGNPVISLAGVVSANQLDYKRVVPMNGGTSLPSAWAPFQLFTGAREALHQISSHTTGNPFGATTGNSFTVVRGTEYFLVTNRRYHYGKEAAALYSIYELANAFGELDFSGRTAVGLQGVADFAETFAGYLRSHIMGRTTAQTFSIRVGGKKYDTFIPTAFSGTSTAGNDLFLHGYQSSVSGGYLVYPASAWQSSGFEQLHFTSRAPDAVSWNYRMCFRYDYTVGSTAFTDRSAPSIPINVIGFAPLSASDASEKGETATAFTNIYAHTNSSVQNYAIADTTNWRKEIYRTVNAGQYYYRVDVDSVAGDVSNSTTTFSYYCRDTYLVNQLALYTNGGLSENDAPPLATALHYALGRMYYIKGSRLYQSIPGDFDSVPGDYFVQADEDLIGVSSSRSVVIAFGLNRVYRVSGARDEFGGGEMLLEPIFDRSGAISSGSIVKADNGVFFAGKDGFYFTDGYQCMRVIDPQDTYISYTNSAAKKARVQGAYDTVAKRVYWTMQAGSGSSPDKIWILDLQYGINPDETPITTFSTLHSFSPTALCFYGGALHFGDADGYTWKQVEDRNIDAKKDTAVAATSWNAAPIIWDVKSCHHDYGSMVLRKYFTRVTAQFEMIDTNLSVQINSDADKGRSISSLPVIRSRKLATAAGYGDSKFDWVPSVYSTSPGDVVDEFRMFKGDGFLRSNYRALEFTNAYTVICNSTEMGTITIGNVVGNIYSATLVSLVLSRKWPLYSVDYYLRLSGVDYPVTIRSSDSAIRFDATGLAAPTTGSPSSWELWGKPKGEKMRMIAYTVNHTLCDDQESDFKGNVGSAGTVSE